MKEGSGNSLFIAGIGPEPIRRVKHWDIQLLQRVNDFAEMFGLPPNIILLNPRTLRKLTLFCRTHLMELGRDHKDFPGLGSIESKFGPIHLCVCESVPKNCFEILLDSAARFEITPQRRPLDEN